MFYCKCINKIRNKNNIIESYELMDLEGNKKIVDKDLLKAKIKDGSVTITNLLLTKDNKLIARSVADETALMKKIGVNKLSSNDEKVILKAKAIGAAPHISKTGMLLSVEENSSIVHITPDVRVINDLNVQDKVVIIHGNNKLEILYGFHCKKLVIHNLTILNHLLEHIIYAETIIIISSDSIDDRIVDFIFKVIKTSEINYVYAKYKILIDKSKLSKEKALNRMKAILKRQKKANKIGRRSYDLTVYIQFMCCLALSYQDSEFLDGIDEYTKELSKINFDEYFVDRREDVKDSKYAYWVLKRVEPVMKLLEEAKIEGQ